MTIELTVLPARGGRYLGIAANGVGELHRDTIDLNSARSRKQFVAAVMQAAFKDKPADDWPADVRDDLDARLLKHAAVPPGAPEQAESDGPPPDPRTAELAKMPADVRAEAKALLADPMLMEHVLAAVRTVGVVGEPRLAMTLYLTGVSAQLPKPLAVIVRGPSSSGKTYTLNRVADLFPPEAVLHATSLTTNALYYFPAGVLRHRFVVAGERSRLEDDDKAEATRALREMIESGRLSKAVPVKKDDQIVTQVIEQEGPIAYAETTTLGHIFEEDANRCLLLATDEREEQTRRILDATAAAAAGREQGTIDRTRAVHHALNRMVPRTDVVIPFAEHVAALYPADQLDARRSFRHLLVLVKASALLHFLQRERDDAGNVVATVADYAAAERLARDPIGMARGGVSDGARLFFAALKAKFGTDEFTTADAQQMGPPSGRRTRYNRLNELNHAGAVEQTEQARGKVPAKWKLTGLDPTAGEGVLPSVQSIIDRLSGCTHARKP